MSAVALGQDPPAAKPSVPNRPADLPDGVIFIALPPGDLRMEDVERNGKPLLRFSVGKTVVEARELFLGDGKGALHFEATKMGIHDVPPGGGEGGYISGVQTYGEGTVLGTKGGFLKVTQLKTGSIYLIAPSIRFVFR